ncbi:sugar kinase [Kitasatospora indigofera]|uniref:sugar kinase n=1 Tax=Kitasatospora indigofera TaxID=67307 RepID=UPI0033A3E4CA
MVLAVTLNTAPDSTRQVRRLVPHGSRVATAVHARAGGKGAGVARAMPALDVPRPGTVREAVAPSAAALPPVAGGFDPPANRRSRTAVPVQEIHVPRHQ